MFLSAEEISDSAIFQLHEITIEAPSLIRKIDKDIYFVNEVTQNQASSALELIRLVHIPQLSVNEVLGTLSSSLGSVQIRINGRKASLEQLKTVNKNYIHKIEWINNPGLRYGESTDAVLNVIVKNPQAGGAFNIAVLEGLSMFFNNASLNLILNQGPSQWTVGAWSSIRRNLEMYREYNESYLLPDGSLIQRTQLSGTIESNSAKAAGR